MSATQSAGSTMPTAWFTRSDEVITFGARNFLQDVDIAGVQVAAGFECDVAARHLGQVGEQILQAFSAVAPVGDRGFGVNDDKTCQQEPRDCIDQIVPAVGAAAVPMDLFLRRETKRFHRFADFRDIVLVAQRYRDQVRVGIAVGLRSALIAPGSQHE